MKLPSGNKKLFFAFSAAILLFLGLVLVFSGQLKKGKDPKKAVDMEIEGVNLTYLSFNKNNEKKLEIKCVESQRGADDKLFMIKITATIFKADKLDKDIHISADAGTTRNDFNNFHLEGHALIASSSFTLFSKSFDLKDMNVLSTKDEVVFKLRNITGQAKKGFFYVINDKYVKMFQAKGVLNRAGKPYDFQAQTLRVVEKKKLLLLDKDAKVEGVNSLLRADRIALQFDQDFAQVVSASAHGKCFFQTGETAKDGRRQSKEISARNIKMTYDPQGRLQKVDLDGDGDISLVDGDGQGHIRSGAIEVSLNSETQILENIRTLTRGTLASRGRDNLTVNADSFLATYSKEGVLAKIQAEKKCEFKTDDFSGTAARLDYDAAKFRVDIFGKDAAVTSKKNTFNSSQFLIETKLKRLSSDKGVKAKLLPEKKNVLLRAKPVLVTASGMEMSEKGNVTGFKGNVKLFQDEIELQAGELLFETRSNRISCHNNADLKFLSENEPVVLHGKTLVFQAGELKIVLEGDARLKQAENVLSARKIEVAFNRNDRLENITAADQVDFSKKDLAGKAQLLYWYFTKKTILFKNAAEITKKDAGTTKGQELLFDLNSNEISVSSTGDRSETIIRQDAP